MKQISKDWQKKGLECETREQGCCSLNEDSQQDCLQSAVCLQTQEDKEKMTK